LSSHPSERPTWTSAGTYKRSCLALHRVGFAQPLRRRNAGALLPHHFTLAGPPFTWDGGRRRFVSVALSRGFPRVDISTTLPFDVRTFLEGNQASAAA